MKRNKLKLKLNKYFADSTVRSILNGSRLPSMSNAIMLKEKEKISLNTWYSLHVNNNIKSKDTIAIRKGAE